MIYAKSTTYGLDTRILLIQNVLQDSLGWFEDVADADISIYGKIYSNPDDQKRVVPEAYITGRMG